MVAPVQEALDERLNLISLQASRLGSQVLSNELDFEWDPGKAVRNEAKHGVSFEEARTVFDDLMFVTVIDDEHSADEERYITIGMSSRARLLMVAHADRNGLIRIISARKATKLEEKFYDDAN